MSFGGPATEPDHTAFGLPAPKGRPRWTVTRRSRIVLTVIAVTAGALIAILFPSVRHASGGLALPGSLPVSVSPTSSQSLGFSSVRCTAVGSPPTSARATGRLTNTGSQTDVVTVVAVVHDAPFDVPLTFRSHTPLSVQPGQTRAWNFSVSGLGATHDGGSTPSECTLEADDSSTLGIWMGP